MKWIDSVRGKRPFFCYIPTNAPHGPLDVRPEDEARYAGKSPNKNVAKYFGMVANIDDNVGRLLDRLAAWDLERSTLVIFMNDNGATVGAQVYNAGMHGAKGTPWLGGTRASSFWRWPGALQPGECDALTAHIDFFPTIAELAGASLTAEVKEQVAGRSLVPLLKDHDADWADRVLFTHVGRWPHGKAAESKYLRCGVRDSAWHLVCTAKNGERDWELFDTRSDYGEQIDVAASHPEVVARLEAAYDRWWDSVQPQLVNETAVGPAENPFKVLFREQIGVAK